MFSKNDKEKAIYLEYVGDKNGNNIPDIEEIGFKHLNSDGDFRSKESIQLLKEADIVVTNPPFSLFRDYVNQLIEYDKKFLIIGNQNVLTYKDIFLHIKNNKIWAGFDNGGTKWFEVPMEYEINTKSRIKIENGKKYFSMGSIYWFTNLDISKRHENIILCKKYKGNEELYPKYDNYDAIEVSKVVDIPFDYDGTMGVPITFLDKYNPDQFEIIGITKTWFGGANKIYPKQIQVSSNGKKSFVTKLNDGATLKLKRPPSNKTYYIVGNEIYIQLYARILIKTRGK